MNDCRVGFSLCSVAVATHTDEAAVRCLVFGSLESLCRNMTLTDSLMLYFLLLPVLLRYRRILRTATRCHPWRDAKVCGQLIKKFADQISSHGCMDDAKREGSDKACRNENRRIRARMTAVRMVRVLNTTDTASSRHAADGCESLDSS